MRKILVFLFTCMLMITPSYSLVSCLTQEQNKIANFVNGYLLAILFFKMTDDKYQLVSNFTESVSQGKIYLENQTLLDNNIDFLSMLDYAKIKSTSFVKQWNFLINFLGGKLGLSLKKDQHNLQYYDFANFYCVSKHSFLEIKSQKTFSTLFWNTYIYINDKKQTYSAIFNSAGEFNFQLWTNQYYMI